MSHACVDCGNVVYRASLKRCRSCGTKHEKLIAKGYYNQTKVKGRLVKERGNRCENCGMSGDDAVIHMHHILPIGDGGITSESNCKLLCFDCHKLEHGGSFSR